MIASFGDRCTADLYHGRSTSRVRQLPADIVGPALRKLDMVNAAVSVEDLRNPPSNRLERLKGDLKGFYSIRVNVQWRVIFRWSSGEASDVQLVDYH